MKKSKLFLIVLLISLFPLKELVKSGAFQSHDFVEHAARLACFYQSLGQGNLVPRWAGNLNYTYGHPVLMFLYPLTNYLGSLIHFFGFSIIDSIKILFALSYIASGLFIFFWIRRLWGEKAAFLSAIFYLFAPYRFVDLYVRAALGEHLAFLFIPLVCWMLTELIKKGARKYLALSAVSLALLILSHNAISLMFFPFIFLYSGWLIFSETGTSRKKTSYQLLVAIFLGFFLACFFWLPALLEGKYTLRELVTNRQVFVNNYLKPQELLFSKWGYGLSSYKEQTSGFLVSLSWFQWLVILEATTLLIFKKIKKKTFSLILLFYLLFGLFLTNSLSKPFVSFIPLIYRFQFPWRFLAVPVFICSLLAGYLLHFYKKEIKLWHILGFSLIIILSTLGYWRIQGTQSGISDAYLLNEYTSTTETGESTPRWALRFQEDYPDDKVQLVYGGLDKVEIQKWDFEEHHYKIAVREDSQIADNTLYFPGWKVWVDGKEAPVKFHDMNWRGIITYPVPVGEHQVMVKFTRTKIRLLADLISSSSLFFIFVFYLWPVKRKRKKR